MSRLLYSFLIYCLSPLLLVHLLWRGRRAPAYLKRWSERFAFINIHLPVSPIWIHAVSVGEVQATRALIRKLRRAYPSIPIIVTTTTPTGSAQVQQLFADTVEHVYAPYDLPGVVKRFLKRVRPQLAIIMETEIWPNIFHHCHAQHIPIILANARLSERSLTSYQRVRRLAQETLACVNTIAAQSESDVARFRQLGARAEQLEVTGSIKFEVDLPASLHEKAEVLRREWGHDRKVFIAASTHSGEDEIILDAFRQIHKSMRDCLLVLVPRHPERFDRVYALCEKERLNVVRRSADVPCDADTDVFLGDSMGELPLFYAASDVAFIGGSLVPHGGQNPLEAAALGLPVFIGPHFFNFAEIRRLLLDQRAAKEVHDATELADEVLRCFRDVERRHQMGEAARQVVESNRGALTALLAIIERYI